MKKIVLATGVVALGLLASCSNDAPVVIPDDSTVNGDYRYIAVNIATTSNTRASSGDRFEGDKDERAIHSATLYLVDSDNEENVIMARTFNAGYDGSKQEGKPAETTISFPVAADYFKSLTENAGNANKKYKLYIVANAESNGFVMNKFNLDEIVEKTAWGSGDKPGQLGRPGYFYMSNDDEIEVSLPAYDATGLQNGSSDANAWPINVNNKVVLTRLAARFDLKIDAQPYSYAINEAGDEATFTITGAGLQHKNTVSYLFRHMSPTGTTDKVVVFGRGDDMHLVTPHGSWYGKTCDPMESCDYKTDLTAYKGTDPDKFDYGFESAINGIATKDSPEEVKKELVSYKNVTYMAFRAEFKYPGWTEGGKEFATYHGEIVGTLEEMTSPDFLPSHMSDENRPYVVNTLNELRNQDGGLDISTEALRKAFIETLRHKDFDYFTPEADGSYLCYYMTPLFNDVDDSETLDFCCKYRVRRNRLYNMDLESIHKIGRDGEFVPDPIIVEETKWIDLNVEIKDWQIVNNSFVF
ncbi:MAG: fimbria major subunit [Muribaculaceae bacterium]|nr:fimbria major subunit [Muribaculaceae bacterium]